MAVVIALSSLVARGNEGLKAIVPAMERLGHEVIALPTIVLSNHLGYRHAAGSAVEPETLLRMLEALDANGWLGEVAAVLTGYLPSEDHVGMAETLIARVRERRPGVLVVCDPVLGDLPKGLYLPQAAADAVRRKLMPLATHLKPNAFELSFVAGRPVRTPAEAVQAARALPVPVVLASSIPAPGGTLANVLVTPEKAVCCTVPFETEVPHGTGDLLTALFVAHGLRNNFKDPEQALAAAAAGVVIAIAASRGSNELNLSGPSSGPGAWHDAPPLPLTELDSGFG